MRVRAAIPAIFSTTLTGAGQGLFLAIHAAEVGARGAQTFFVAGSATAVALAALGLFAAFFGGHRLQTAWRVRETIAVLLFMALAVTYGAAHHDGWEHMRAIGAAASAAALVLFFCTAMAHARMNFLADLFLMGCASGFMLAVPLAACFAPHLVKLLAMAAIGLTIAALLVRLASLQRSDGHSPAVTLHGSRMRFAFIVLAFLAPIALVHAGTRTGLVGLLAAAFVVQYVGLAMERWHYLAEADRSQNLHDQNMS
jgi:sulfite dehydrogenase (quinone) subunit SoeC